MKTVWKVLLGLALVVPVGAYVAGSLAASATDDPAPRHTIEIREPNPTRSLSPSGHSTPSGSPPSTQSSTPTNTPSDDDVEVITPYDDLGDDHGDDRGDDHGDDRHGGHDDDHSGHGGKD